MAAGAGSRDRAHAAYPTRPPRRTSARPPARGAGPRRSQLGRDPAGRWCGTHPGGGVHSPVLVVGSGGGAAGGPSASFSASIWVTYSWLSGASWATALAAAFCRAVSWAGVEVTYSTPQLTRSWATVLPGVVKIATDVAVMFPAAVGQGLLRLGAEAVVDLLVDGQHRREGPEVDVAGDVLADLVPLLRCRSAAGWPRRRRPCRSGAPGRRPAAAAARRSRRAPGSRRPAPATAGRGSSCPGRTSTLTSLLLAPNGLRSPPSWIARATMSPACSLASASIDWPISPPSTASARG